MNSIDCRNQTFDSIQRSLNALRLAAHCAWLDHGPGTTREVAKKSAIDILTFRPRTTELVDMGLVVMTGRQSGEGIYRAASQQEWEEWHAKTFAPAGQQQLL